MASAIDATKPVAGSPTTQSVRDNFATAASEITALQALTVTPPYSVAIGGTGRNTLTANRPLVGNGTSAVTLSTAMAINTGVVIGNPAADPGQGGLTLNQATSAVPQPANATLGTPLLWGAKEAAWPQVLLDAYGTSGPLYVGRQARGTAAAPTAVQAGDAMVSLIAQGRGTTGYSLNSGAIALQASEPWTDTAQGTRILLATSLPGSTTSNTHVMVQAGMMLGSNLDAAPPTGGDMGVGTVNVAGGYYVHGQNITVSPTFTGNVSIGSAQTSWPFYVGGATGAGAVATLQNTTTLAGDVVLQMLGGTAGGSDTTTQMIRFLDNTAVTIGAISRSGATSVAYNTTSDARLKEDITESKRGLDALMAIQVSDYKMGKTANQGLLAQDVAKVYPEAVHEGGKDPNLQPWMLDYGRLTPLLIKGMQQQQEMIAALQAKVAALQAKVAALESATVH